jgi:hypothetical protein
MQQLFGVLMILLRHLFRRALPWVLGSLLAGYLLIGMLGDLLPGRLPPMQNLRLEVPPTIVLSPQQAPTVTARITNTSPQMVTGCRITGDLEDSNDLGRIAEVFSLSSHFHLAGGAHTTVVLSLPPGVIPRPETRHEIALSITCAEPAHLEQRVHITLLMPKA